MKHLHGHFENTHTTVDEKVTTTTACQGTRQRRQFKSKHSPGSPILRLSLHPECCNNESKRINGRRGRNKTKSVNVCARTGGACHTLYMGEESTEQRDRRLYGGVTCNLGSAGEKECVEGWNDRWKRLCGMRNSHNSRGKRFLK